MRATSMAVVIAALSLAQMGSVFAEEPLPESPRWTVQVDPLTTALGFVHFQVERAVGDSLSIYAGPSLRLFTAPWEDPEEFVGYGLEAGLRWFFYGGAPNGWWAQVRGVAALLETTTATPSESALGGYGSVLAGYTSIWSGWFVLSGGLGLQYLHYRVAGLGPKGLLPAAHTTVGFAF